jgi:Holliday junction resolvase RusA-like endonuclease
MPTITFTVPGVPVGKGRPRFFADKRSGIIRGITPEKTVSYEAQLKYHFLKAVGQLWKPLDCPIVISIIAFFPMPKSANKSEKESGSRRKTTKPDLDNIIKSVCDGLNKMAWVDDSRVWYIKSARKFETIDMPRLLVEIEY